MKMYSAKFLVDAHRPAMDEANNHCLPKTVFYHPDWGFSHATTQSSILFNKHTEQFVTWLPENYFS